MRDACAVPVFDHIGSFHSLRDLGLVLQQFATMSLQVRYAATTICVPLQVTECQHASLRISQ